MDFSFKHSILKLVVNFRFRERKLICKFQNVVLTDIEKNYKYAVINVRVRLKIYHFFLICFDYLKIQLNLNEFLILHIFPRLQR